MYLAVSRIYEIKMQTIHSNQRNSDPSSEEAILWVDMSLGTAPLHFHFSCQREVTLVAHRTDTTSVRVLVLLWLIFDTYKATSEMVIHC